MTNVFEVGKPIPKVWLHFEFDYEDTVKYLNREDVIPDKVELKRLADKYLDGDNKEMLNELHN